MEEFGLARDAWRHPNDTKYKYNPKTPTSHKDKYYQAMFDNTKDFAGTNFWAYSGLGRSTDLPNEYGMVWLGGKVKKHIYIIYCIYILMLI